MSISSLLEKFSIMLDKKTGPVCSFCEKNRKEVKQIIAGPNVAICNECLIICSDVLRTDEDDSKNSKFEEAVFNFFDRLLPNPSPQKESEPKPTCSFCSKQSTQVEKLILGPRTAICSECVPLCQDTLDGNNHHPGLMVF